LLYDRTTYPHEQSRFAYDAYCSSSTKNPGPIKKKVSVSYGQSGRRNVVIGKGRTGREHRERVRPSGPVS
jgi:hypothetical protein